jgi:hypothetical protein
MKAFKGYLITASIVTMLIALPGAMTVFLHYVTLLELYARLNGAIFYPIAGVIWVFAFYAIVANHVKTRETASKMWVVPTRLLDTWTEKFEMNPNDKYTIVRKVDNETSNN